MIAAIALAIVVSFTLPDSNAAVDSVGRSVTWPFVCDRGSFLLSDLDSAFVWVQSYAHPQSYVARALGVRGLEGEPCSVAIPDADTTGGQVQVVTSDRAGNRSCGSNVVLLHGGALEAPRGPPPLESGPSRLYDLSGRRVQPPLAPGVYFERHASGVQRIVVIR